MAINVANNQSLTAITALPSAVSGSAMTLLSTATASGDSTITFDSNIDSTYKEYVFKFYDLNPATDNVDFMFSGRDGSTAYDATKTTTHFKAYHDEADTDTSLTYDTGRDLAQSTGFQTLIQDIGNGADESASCYETTYRFRSNSNLFIR